MLSTLRSLLPRRLPQISRVSSSFSTNSGAGGDCWDQDWNTAPKNPQSSSSLDWDQDSSSTWSTGLTKSHFDGEQPIGTQQIDSNPLPKPPSAREIAMAMDEEEEIMKNLENDNRRDKKFVDGWNRKMMETYKLLKQVREPGMRGEYLREADKKEMYRLYKENPEVNTVEKLAKDFQVMRQRVHAILWLQEDEEEMERKSGKQLNGSVETLLDSFPEFFNYHDKEFHVASLPYKPDFKVMPEDWDGTTRDPDEVLYEISMKEDHRLYEDFVQRLKFNKKKVAGEVKCHAYSRRRPDKGWNITIEKLGSRDKRGGGGGWKFVSLADGSSRPLNEMEKMYVKREKAKPRKKIIFPL